LLAAASARLSLRSSTKSAALTANTTTMANALIRMNLTPVAPETAAAANWNPLPPGLRRPKRLLDEIH
jgi:hypothetical protein